MYVGLAQQADAANPQGLPVVHSERDPDPAFIIALEDEAQFQLSRNLFCAVHQRFTLAMTSLSVAKKVAAYRIADF